MRGWWLPQSLLRTSRIARDISGRKRVDEQIEVVRRVERAAVALDHAVVDADVRAEPEGLSARGAGEVARRRRVRVLSGRRLRARARLRPHRRVRDSGLRAAGDGARDQFGRCGLEFLRLVCLGFRRFQCADMPHRRIGSRPSKADPMREGRLAFLSSNKARGSAALASSVRAPVGHSQACRR